MLLKFTKMHGLGNDFAVFDGISQKLSFMPEIIKKLSHRHFGIGIDQLLFIERAESVISDIHYRIFNADGSEANQCGNGIRCIARFLHEKKIVHKSILKLSGKAGMMTVDIKDNGLIQVDMGLPKKISFIDIKQPMTFVSMGNPHTILRVDDVAFAAVDALGSQISHDSFFPDRTNVEFMEIINRHRIKLRVYERGVGETLACGTGACAAVVAGIVNGWLDSSVSVQLSGGELEIEWQGEGYPVMMTGPAVTVYEGMIVI